MKKNIITCYNNIMKKLSKIIIIFICSFVLFGCNKTKEAIESTNINTIINKFYNQDTFILTINADSCLSCDEFSNIEEKTLKASRLMTYSINYDDLDEESIKNLKKHVGDIKVLPSVYYIVNGEVINQFEYEGSLDAWKQWLKKIKSTRN